MSARGYKRILGVSDEATLGIKATTGFKYIELDSESLSKNIPPILGEAGIRGIAAPVRRPQGLIDITGSLEGSIYPEGGFPVILWAAMGAVSTAQASGTAYKSDFTLVDDTTFGDSVGLTFKAERDISNAFDFYGCVVQTLTFSSAQGALAKFTAEVLGMNQDTASTPSATYTTPAPFIHHQATFTVMGTSTDVSDWNIVLANNLKTDFYGATQTRLKFPRMGRRDITGTLTKPVVEDTDEAAIYNKFIAGTSGALTILFTGATITGAYTYQLYISCPVIYFDGPADFASGGIETPGLSIPFRAFAQSDGTLEMSAYIYSTETSI